jgi:hypothetical protein
MGVAAGKGEASFPQETYQLARPRPGRLIIQRTPHAKGIGDMAKSHRIGPHTFDTQAAAVTFIQEVLYRHPLLGPISGDDHAFLLELLKKHPHAAEKVGAGVKHFTVENAKGGTRCFYVTRVDGSRSDFSFMKCLRG